MERLEKVSDKNFKSQHFRSVERQNQNVWACAYELVEKILQRYTGENDIAMAIVDYGRKYGGAEFYDCVGGSWTLFLLCLVKEKLRNWKSFWIFVITIPLISCR